MSKWLGGAYKSSASHLDQQQTLVLIRDDKIKWLHFGTTPDPENLQPHPRFVWVKSGYSETIAWRKVQLTKQRNVDLTTDGLWAMPLNTGWVPVKACRLQDWEKLKEICSKSQAGGCVPQWGPCPCGKGQQCRQFGFRIISGPSSIALSCALSTLQLHLLKKVII